MTNVRLSLSRAARRNLQDICREFDRCSRNYPPLYHQRMMPLSERGSVGISPSQWEAFRIAVSEELGTENWWRWEPLGDGDQLGQWLGDGDGLGEFVELSEAVAMALSQDAMDFDPLDFNLEVRHGSDWLPLLHDWAFKYQMPLLRSRMTLWGCEDYALDHFYELAEQWETLEDGTSIPRHPVVWRLIDNVFTSSMAGLRALLSPEAVIATNEPWPLSTTPPLFRHSVVGEGENATDHGVAESVVPNSFRYDGITWRIQYEADEKEGVLRGYEGPYRVAVLLQKPFNFFEYPELSFNPSTENTLNGADELEKRATKKQRQGIHAGDKADPEWKRAIAKRLRELSQLIGEAEASGTAREIAELKEEREKLKRYRRMYLNKYGVSRKDADEWDQARKTVTKSLAETIQRISDQLPVLGAHLNEYVHIDRGVIYEPPSPEVQWNIQIGR